MATIKNTTAARDVVADLLGDSPVKKSKGNKKAGRTGKEIARSVLAKRDAKAAKLKADKKTAVRSLTKVADKKVVKTGRVGRFSVDMKIKVLKDRENEDGSTIATIWKMVKSSKTVGDFDKARRDSKVKIDNLAGIANRYLLAFVREKNIKIAA